MKVVIGIILYRSTDTPEYRSAGPGRWRVVSPGDEGTQDTAYPAARDWSASVLPALSLQGYIFWQNILISTLYLGLLIMTKIFIGNLEPN